MELKMILASDDKNWIWKSWDLAWRIKEDMKYFQNITTSTDDDSKINAVIMWEKTWKSIPEKYRPLPWRINVVLSRNPNFNDSWCIKFDNIDDCVFYLESNNDLESKFIIWGAMIYNQFLNHPDLTTIYHTKVCWDFDCDVIFDWIPDYFKLDSESELKEENWIKFSFQTYKKD